MAKGPRPLSDDADATIDDPNIVNDKEDLVITKTKQTPKQAALGIIPQIVNTAATSFSNPTTAQNTQQPFVQPNTATTPGFGSTTPGFAQSNTTATPGFGSTSPGFAPPGGFGSAPAAPPNVYQQQANAEIDKKILDQQLPKENENWVKAYWRPAMGWLYMLICGMDFVGFPLLTIFLPVIFQPFGLTVPYQTWQSLTLANGGLIHLSFGAILGVAAFTRGQEKMAGKA